MRNQHILYNKRIKFDFFLLIWYGKSNSGCHFLLPILFFSILSWSNKCRIFLLDPSSFNTISSLVVNGPNL